MVILTDGEYTDLRGAILAHDPDLARELERRRAGLVTDPPLVHQIANLALTPPTRFTTPSWTLARVKRLLMGEPQEGEPEQVPECTNCHAPLRQTGVIQIVAVYQGNNEAPLDLYCLRCVERTGVRSVGIPCGGAHRHVRSYPLRRLNGLLREETPCVACRDEAGREPALDEEVWRNPQPPAPPPQAQRPVAAAGAFRDMPRRTILDTTAPAAPVNLTEALNAVAGGWAEIGRDEEER